MNNYFIIGDIAGQMDALRRLIKKAPPNSIPISVGDMIDRGPDSVGVVEFFKANGQAVLGNHEDMFLDFIKKENKYHRGVYLRNGGTACLHQFEQHGAFNYDIPAEFIDYLAGLPERIEIAQPDWSRSLVITHAPLLDGYLDAEAAELGQFWNRGWTDQVKEIPGKLQLFGHNGFWGHQTWENDKDEVYAVNLDGSRDDLLVGIAWPSGEVFVEEY